MPYDAYLALPVDGDDRASMESDKTRLPTSSTSNLDHTAKLACQRASPLICPNQDLIEQIKIIRHSRELDGNSMSTLVYSRAISVCVISSFSDVCLLSWLTKVIKGMMQLLFESRLITLHLCSLSVQNRDNRAGFQTSVCRRKAPTQSSLTVVLSLWHSHSRRSVNI
jgi:hypothetical protein